MSYLRYARLLEGILHGGVHSGEQHLGILLHPSDHRIRDGPQASACTPALASRVRTRIATSAASGPTRAVSPGAESRAHLLIVEHEPRAARALINRGDEARLRRSGVRHASRLGQLTPRRGPPQHTNSYVGNSWRCGVGGLPVEIYAKRTRDEGSRRKGPEFSPYGESSVDFAKMPRWEKQVAGPARRPIRSFA